jgi:hypothetical protein
MAEVRPLPTNYWTQRKTRNMSPSARGVGAFLWTNRNTTSCGVYQIDPAEIACATGYDESTTKLHMRELATNHHIVYDEETSEIFILDWFRFHKFKGPGRQILLRDLERIESSRLAELASHSAYENHLIEDKNSHSINNQRRNSPTTTSTEHQPQLQPQQPLLYPKGLTPEQQNLIARELDEFQTDTVQAALDEYSGRAKRTQLGVIHDPVAWIRMLLRSGVRPSKHGLEARDLRLYKEGTV